MTGRLEAFRRRWAHVNQMSVTFAETVPDESWEFSPHPGFAPFHKQLRHVVCVRGVYNEGLRLGRVDFSRKHEHYTGGLGRAELLAALAGKHEAALALLDQPWEIDEPSIEFFGRVVSPADYLMGWVQHEAIHHGQWSLYAAHGGFDVPELWRVQWGLGVNQV